MNKKPCNHEILGVNESGRVQICRDCDVVHLHLQNMSLRFDSTQFAQLALLIAQSSKKMIEEPEGVVHRKLKFTLVH